MTFVVINQNQQTENGQEAKTENLSFQFPTNLYCNKLETKKKVAFLAIRKFPKQFPT